MGSLAGRSNGGKGTLRQEHWWEGTLRHGHWRVGGGGTCR